ncbi:MAG TPA: acetoacetate--CoA ligase [Solirubrobacteraceae bacterium]|jgi:acetoacetyl-CoA synthetase|nr:acetoacetate--CoA ligase [Solirubrobacteraceae bacterium]
MSDPEILWSPNDEDVATAAQTHFMNWLRAERGVDLDGPDALWTWSVTELEAFWGAVYDYFEVASDAPYSAVLDRRVMPGAKWFEGATLNYAEHILRNATAERPAMVVLAENEPIREISWATLVRDVAALAHTLREAGLQPGDRVCGYMSNVPETVVAMIACVSIGAVWSVCAPDFGLSGAKDRFAQLEPKVLLGVDGYRFGGKKFSRLPELAELREALPTVELTIIVPSIGAEGPRPAGRVIDWDTAVADDAELQITRLPFSHPLWVLFSSGTTGLPKGIVQSHGGITVEQLKAGALGLDLRPTDRFYFFSSTSWMVWNFVVGTLLRGCTIVLYDGSPGFPDMLGNWRVASESGATVFGTGAAYLSACEKAGAEPAKEMDLSALRVVISTGSVLPASTWKWFYSILPAHVRLDSSSGGTDVCSGFVGGNALKPVHHGEITGPYLGVRAEAWNGAGESVINEVGELVIVEPMPSMPTHFWNDPDGQRYHDSYFDMYPGRWRHGDWIRVTERGTVVIEGRSDSTLNKAGVRMGSADVYAVVEPLAGVADSLVVGVDLPDAQYYMPLFVVPADGREVDDELRAEIIAAIRRELSPRHVPDEIIATPRVPRTRTGKKLEVPVKRILSGVPIESAVNLGSVDDPDAVRWYVDFAAARR